jgi:hypothetical protein
MLAPLGEDSAGPTRVGLLLVLLLSALYGYLFFDRGWIPHDEGTVALGAQRFLSGEMPHRDYNEAYTGGLTLLHAIAFRFFGTNLVSLRLVLFLFFLPFAAALYGIALRLVNPAPAVLVTLLGAAWSVPNYFASLPSWYNLFFATFGGLALIRHLETGRARWLFLAGLCGGVSVLFKIVGLYFIAAALLFLVWREAGLWAERRAAGRDAFFLLKAAGSAVFLSSLVYLLRQRLGPMEVFHYLLPPVALVGLLLADEWKRGGATFADRLGGLLRLVAPFLLGVALPVGFFVVPFAANGALDDLIRGVFVLPQKQIATATFDLPPFWALLPALPYALVLLFPRAIPARLGRRLALAVSLLLAVVLALAFLPGVYRAIWYSALSLVPIATLAGCFALARGPAIPDASGRKRPIVFLLLCLTALVGLVQFPYAAPIYFCYFAPLAVLAITAIVSGDPAAPRAVHVGVLAFYLLFAALFMNTGYVFNLGHRYERYVADDRLDLERGGLRLPKNEAGKYEYLIAAIEEHSGGGEIYAGPDCPEVYFLSGRRNPTRSFFEFLGEYSARAESLLPLLEARKTRLLVLNRQPDFSPQPDLDLILALRTRYPKWALVGEFLLMWKD